MVFYMISFNTPYACIRTLSLDTAMKIFNNEDLKKITSRFTLEKCKDDNILTTEPFERMNCMCGYYFKTIRTHFNNENLDDIELNEREDKITNILTDLCKNFKISNIKPYKHTNLKIFSNHKVYSYIYE